MRILFLTHYYYPEGNAPATRIHELTRRWAERGHNVTVITAAPNVPSGVVYDGYENKWKQRENIDGVGVVRVWTYLAANAGIKRRTLSYLSFMVTATLAGLRESRPDVVIATSPQFFCGWAGRLVSRFRRLPFVLEIRDLWPESIVAVGAMDDALLVRFLENLEMKLYGGASHIVTVGEPYRRKLLDRGVPGGKLSIVSNGVDLDRYSGRSPSPGLFESLALEGRFVCAYVGTIGMASGLEVVIRAGEILRKKGNDKICFLLVGDGANRENLQLQAARRKLDNVIFTGRIGKDEVPAVLAEADACLVHLIKSELFETVIPSKMFEAAAMRKPVILGVGGYASELIREAGAGICIEPENENELVAAVEKLCDDRAATQHLGDAGRALVSRQFDYNVLAQSYLDELERLVAENK